MANAKNIRGTNPQNLVEKIVRSKIHQNTFWKEQCFGLTAETLVDKAMELDHVGGTFGGNRKPTPFICLVMKMLHIQPEKDIVVEFIKNDDYKYVRALGAFYLRLTGTDSDIYRYLEPLYNDYRKLKQKLPEGKFALTYVDDFIDQLLTKDYSCDIAMPRIKKRYTLESLGALEPRKSVLEDDFEEEEKKQDNGQLDGLEDGVLDKDNYRGRDSHRHRYDRDRDRERDRYRDRYRLREEKEYGRDRDQEARDRERRGRRRSSRSRSPKDRKRHVRSISPRRHEADDHGARQEPKKKKKENKDDSTGSRDCGFPSK